MAKQTSILNFFNKVTPAKSSPLSANTSINNSINKTKPEKHKFDNYDIIWARLDG